MTIVRGLPAGLNAAVFIVVHTASESPGLLAKILSRDGQIPAIKARDGMGIEPARIYVAPPDSHMLVDAGRVRLDRGPTENRYRPAIDPLFRSAAAAYGPAVVGVVLSGYLDDGTRGLQVIKAHGGTAVVQDPGDASVPSMPLNAIEHNVIDHRLPASEIAPLLVELADGSERMVAKKKAKANKEGLVENAEPSVFSCPDCHGCLWKIDENGLTRFRCRIGHVYSMDSLLEAQRDSVERAMWAAVRSLEEDAELSQRMYQTAAGANHNRAAERFRKRTEYCREHADVIRGILLGNNSPVSEMPDVDEIAEKADDSAA